MRVTLAQISPKLNRSNLALIVKIIKEQKNNSDLIVFPELALSGYLLQDKLYEDAWSEDELSELCELSGDVDIAVGLAMRDGDVFRNSALYFHNKKILSKHIKVHLPNYGMFEEARYFEGGDSFEVFSNGTKKISMVISEDLWHQDVHKELKALNPDIIIALVASPARGFCDDGLEIEDRWYEIIQTLAKDVDAKVIFVNRVGFEDGLGFWGGSCIVDESGKIIHKMQKFKKDIKIFEV